MAGRPAGETSPLAMAFLVLKAPLPVRPMIESFLESLSSYPCFLRTTQKSLSALKQMRFGGKAIIHRNIGPTSPEVMTIDRRPGQAPIHKERGRSIDAWHAVIDMELDRVWL